MPRIESADSVRMLSDADSAIHGIDQHSATNPVEANAIAEVADMLSAAGYGEQALVWYSTLVDVYESQGTLPSKQSLVNYLAERYRAGETTVAEEQVEKNLQVLPEDADFWFLRLTIQSGDESPEVLKQAEQAFLRRLNFVCGRIVPEQAGAASATQPAVVTPAAQPAATRAATTQPATTRSVAESKATTRPATDVAATSQPASTPAIRQRDGNSARRGASPRQDK